MVFQSSPTSKGGRYNNGSWCGDNIIQFQSSPTSKGGRYGIINSIQAKRTLVSILAHLERWALLWYTPGINWTDVVSILAHLERWALHHPGGTIIILHMFQSSPTSKGGRYSGDFLSRGCDAQSFNPRPPRKVGATHPPRVINEEPVQFQSSPTSKGGRYGIFRQLIRAKLWFQSSPTSKGGRYTPDSYEALWYWCFNPRPPRKVGATSPHARSSSSVMCFNPRPPRKVGATVYDCL